MKIYIDFDDCLCETGRAFAGLAAGLFGIDVPYEDMRHFNLQRSFSLTDEQYDLLLARGHEQEILLSFEETPGASAVINEWIAAGHDVSIITGRPFSAYEPSRAWLDSHGLQDARLYCLDKYGRENFLKGSSFSLEPEDYYRMNDMCCGHPLCTVFNVFNIIGQVLLWIVAIITVVSGVKYLMDNKDVISEM